MSAYYCIDVVRGDCIPIEYTFEADLTGYSAEMAFAWTGADLELTTAAATLTLAEDTAWATQPAWTLTGEVPAVTTADWPLGKSVTFALRLIDPDGCKDTVILGDVKVSPTPFHP